MAIGSILSKANNSKLGAILTSVLGSPDLHCHTRLRPVLNYFKKRNTERLKILEIGCGTGGVLIEISSIGPAFSATGFDIDQKAIGLANRHLELLSSGRDVKFIIGDALAWDTEDTFDVILLIDILEHLYDTTHVMETVSRRLKPGGTLLVSVPTPIYSRIFGQQFHEWVGHVRNGYTRKELLKECSQFVCIRYSYNTGPLFWIPCALSYRIIRHIKNYRAQTFLNYLLVPFAKLDLWHPANYSCSLFAEFERPV